MCVCVCVRNSQAAHWFFQALWTCLSLFFITLTLKLLSVHKVNLNLCIHSGCLSWILKRLPEADAGGDGDSERKSVKRRNSLKHQTDSSLTLKIIYAPNCPTKFLLSFTRWIQITRALKWIRSPSDGDQSDCCRRRVKSSVYIYIYWGQTTQPMCTFVWPGEFEIKKQKKCCTVH